MAGTSYTGWSVAKLEKEKERIDKVIDAKRSESRSKAIDELKQVAEKNGFDLKDLVGGGSGAKKNGVRKTTGKVAPKYRNPDDSSVTWSGRGRQPKWVVEHAKKNNGDLSGISI